MEEQVKTQQDFVAKQKALAKQHRAKPRNPNHIVTPNLTPRGRDILMRLQNKSIDTRGERSYTLREDIVNARRMSKHELVAQSKKTAEKITELKAKLQSNERRNS